MSGGHFSVRTAHADGAVTVRGLVREHAAALYDKAVAEFTPGIDRSVELARELPNGTREILRWRTSAGEWREPASTEL